MTPSWNRTVVLKARPCGMLRLADSVLIKRLTTVFGFIMSDHADRRPACVQEMGAWYRPGRIRVREDAVDGFENAPAAFIRMLRGENLGRTLVRVAGAPAA